jgi:hypothetical protein
MEPKSSATLFTRELDGCFDIGWKKSWLRRTGVGARDDGGGDIHVEEAFKAGIKYKMKEVASLVD